MFTVLFYMGLQFAVSAQDDAVRAILDANGLYDVSVDEVVVRNSWNEITHLELNSMGIFVIPAEIGNLSYLNVLRLRNNRLTTLPPEIKDVGNKGIRSGFTELDLRYNMIYYLPEEMADIVVERFNSDRVISIIGNYLCKDMVPDTVKTMLDRRAEITWRAHQTCDTPLLILNGGAMSVAVNYGFIDPGATAHDAVDGDISSLIEVAGEVDTTTPGSYTLTYSIMNSAGVEAIKQRIVNVVIDSIPPVISLYGDTLSIWEMRMFIDSVSAWDDMDGDVTSRIERTGVLDSSVAGTYTLEYSVADRSGNYAFATRTVIVQKDTTPPRLILDGDLVMYLEINSQFAEPGFTATDLNGTENLTSEVSIISPFPDMSTVGTYEVVYEVTDVAGNSITATRTIHVMDPKFSNSLIRVNQIGYFPDGPKMFTYGANAPDSFRVRRENDDQIVFTSALNPPQRGFHSGEQHVRTGDFSAVSEPGLYYVEVMNAGRSPTFQISSNIYTEVFRAALKAFYYQRASMSLEEKYAGKWSRPAGHPDTSCLYHLTSGSGNSISSPGGWYDAGDYGKYVVNAGITLWSLLSFYELFPDAVPDGFLNIPESGNGISDLLDEVKYELDWLKTMQPPGGGVYFKIAGLEWPDFVMPHEDTQQRYVIGMSTTSTLNFAAVMAMAARIYDDIDSDYAQDCLERAERAYSWANSNRTVSHPDVSVGSGLYDDSSYEDEFIWAAAELYITTGNDDYLPRINNITANYYPASWRTVKNLAVFSLIANGHNVSTGAVTSHSQSVVNKVRTDPYSVPSHFYWGSNSVILNDAIGVLFASMVSDNDSLHFEVMKIMDYMFGRNPLNKSYVTGFGHNPPRFPHHRPSGADNNEKPVPGFLVGGPNYGREDSMDPDYMVNYTYTAYSKSYMDLQESYASNEVAINWNAPLVFVLGFLHEKYKNDTESPFTLVEHKKPPRQSGLNIRSVRFTENGVQFRCDLNNAQSLRVNVYDLKGKVVLSQIYDAVKGNNLVNVSTNKPVASGTYLLWISSGDRWYQSRVILYR